RTPLPGWHDDQHEDRHAESEKLLDELLPLCVPGYQHANASTNGLDVVQDQIVEFQKRVIFARLDGCQNFQHLVRAGKSTASRETIRLGADKKQVQQGFLSPNGICE